MLVLISDELYARKTNINSGCYRRPRLFKQLPNNRLNTFKIWHITTSILFKTEFTFQFLFGRFFNINF